jgi:hypothetical protein
MSTASATDGFLSVQIEIAFERALRDGDWRLLEAAFLRFAPACSANLISAHQRREISLAALNPFVATHVSESLCSGTLLRDLAFE